MHLKPVKRADLILIVLQQQQKTSKTKRLLEVMDISFFLTANDFLGVCICPN